VGKSVVSRRTGFEVAPGARDNYFGIDVGPDIEKTV
jgi:hypothetical protein